MFHVDSVVTVNCIALPVVYRYKIQEYSPDRVKKGSFKNNAKQLVFAQRVTFAVVRSLEVLCL